MHGGSHKAGGLPVRVVWRKDRDMLISVMLDKTKQLCQLGRKTLPEKQKIMARGIIVEVVGTANAYEATFVIDEFS